MPNDLTGKADLNQQIDSELDIEAIRNDLQDDDIFSIAYQKGNSDVLNPEVSKKSSSALPLPQEANWLESSDS